MNKKLKSAPPDIESRFLEPKGWRWHSFRNKDNLKLRFGSVYPEDGLPDAVIVILPGRTEFAEKYFELAHDLLKHNLAVWIMDWRGQGKSDRLTINPQKCHSPDFRAHVEDLHEFIEGYVKHASVNPDVGRIPMVMLTQSMGGNIGLHYLQKYSETFACAAFCAPMTGIKALKAIPAVINMALLGFLNILASKSYAFGQKDWEPDERKNSDITLTSDDKRNAVHDLWMIKNPDLRLGGVTFGWLYNAFKSCRRLKKSGSSRLKTPDLIFLAGKEDLVNNKQTKNILSTAEIIEFAEAGHEIIMERDEIRNKFLDAFLKLIRESVIENPETLKPF